MGPLWSSECCHGLSAGPRSATGHEDTEKEAVLGCGHPRPLEQEHRQDPMARKREVGVWLRLDLGLPWERLLSMKERLQYLNFQQILASMSAR